MNLYTSLLRPLFFKLDAERAHEWALEFLRLAPPAVLRLVFRPQTVWHPVRAFGLEFPNPVGLAAGMDKNATALPAWEALGFGFAEIGTVTALAQPGNPKPRLFRYPDCGALINRMGFNNPGAAAIASRLGRLRRSGRWPRIPVGMNLGKSRVTPKEEAAADYLESLRHLRDFGDFFVVNVSSPNTPGLRDLQEAALLRPILQALRGEAPEKPLLVKLAPDLTDDEAVALAGLAEECGLSGIIATNTTLDHSAIPASSDEQGGLSGRPLEERSTAMVRVLRRASRLPVVASGGIMDARSAAAKRAAGADLLEIYTGFVYRGPVLIGEITRALQSPPGPPNPIGGGTGCGH